MNEFDNFCDEYSEKIGDEREAFRAYCKEYGLAENMSYIKAYPILYNLWAFFGIKKDLDYIKNIILEETQEAIR